MNYEVEMNNSCLSGQSEDVKNSPDTGNVSIHQNTRINKIKFIYLLSFFKLVWELFFI